MNLLLSKFPKISCTINNITKLTLHLLNLSQNQIYCSQLLFLVVGLVRNRFQSNFRMFSLSSLQRKLFYYKVSHFVWRNQELIYFVRSKNILMVTMKIYYCMSLSAVFYADCIYYTFNGYTFNKSTVWQNTLSKTHTKTQLNLGGLC